MKKTEIIPLPIACNYESFVAFGYWQSADRELCKYATAVRSGDADTDYDKDEPKAFRTYLRRTSIPVSASRRKATSSTMMVAFGDRLLNCRQLVLRNGCRRL